MFCFGATDCLLEENPWQRLVELSWPFSFALWCSLSFGMWLTRMVKSHWSESPHTRINLRSRIRLELFSCSAWLPLFRRCSLSFWSFRLRDLFSFESKQTNFTALLLITYQNYWSTCHLCCLLLRWLWQSRTIRSDFSEILQLSGTVTWPTNS